jgi:hypothetical protein
LVSTKSLSCVCPLERSARRRLPSRGSLGPRFPTFHGTMRRYDCHHAPLGSLRLSLASRYLACSSGSWSPRRARCLVEAPRQRQGFWSPGLPIPGISSRRQMALPSSRVPPVKTCPALRPRWCPVHSPSRTQDCCLPATGNRRLSSLYCLERYPVVHNYTHFGAQSRGLPPRYTRLRTAPCGEARGFAPDRLAKR